MSSLSFEIFRKPHSPCPTPRPCTNHNWMSAVKAPALMSRPKRRAGTPQSYEAKIRRFGAIVENVPPNVAGHGGGHHLDVPGLR